MKNMKLTNLSLSVLIALGLVACGGSDNKDNAPLDKDQHGEAGGNGGKPEVTPEHTGTLPQRYSPSLNVPDDLKGQVAARKRFAIRRSFADLALGYNDPWAVTYNSDLSTDPADLKKRSIYNYVEEKDFVTVSADGKEVTGGYEPGAKGAISIGGFGGPAQIAKFNTKEAVLNTWVKGVGGKYYRVIPEHTWDQYSPKTKFKVVDPGVGAEKLDGGLNPKEIPQSAVVFIANADIATDGSTTEIELGKGGYILGDASKQKQVTLDSLSVFGNTYKVQNTNQNLDMSKLPVDASKIQVEKINGNYHISNSKGTPQSNDDKTIYRTALLGNVKVYNLPHSIAFVTTNDKITGEKNVFNLDGNGAFQLNGLETPSLPKDGRAIYAGKSFSADIEGDIELTADFFENEAGILGRVFNRKQVSTGDSLDELTLEKIVLSSPTHHSTGSDYGVVKGDNNYADNWTVQLYGMDAQEAGGFLRKLAWKTVKGNQVIDLDKTEIKEIYTSQRQKLGNKSNDNTVK